MLVILLLVLSRYCYRTFIQTYSASSPFNPHWQMDKTLSPSYSSSQIKYVEAEAVKFSRFRFHRKRTASSFRLHIPGDRVIKSHNTQTYSTNKNNTPESNDIKSAYLPKLGFNIQVEPMSYKQILKVALY